MHDVTDRARGLIVGIAAGNLLGFELEGWPPGRIAAVYPHGVREIEARPGWPDDDDLAQALVIAAASGEGPLDPHDLGRRFWAWAEMNGAGMGRLTLDVLEAYGGSAPQFLMWRRPDARVREPAGVSILEASRASWRGSRAGNGAAMRCAPIAVRWRHDAVALVRNSIVSAVPTHWDRRCGWSCALLNLAAAAALRGEPTTTADELLDAALDGVRASLHELQQYGYEARVPDSVRDAVRQASEVEVADLRLAVETMGYTLLALQVGLNVYWRAADFEPSLRGVVEAGGDTDTNGAVAGALLGARFGVRAIPERWRNRIAKIRAGRTSLETYAERLLAVGA